MILAFFQTELHKVPLFLRMIHRQSFKFSISGMYRNRSLDCLDSAWRYHYVFVLVWLKSVFIKIWEVIAVFTYCAVGKAWRSEYRRYVSEKKDVMEDTLSYSVIHDEMEDGVERGPKWMLFVRPYRTRSTRYALLVLLLLKAMSLTEEENRNGENSEI